MGTLAQAAGRMGRGSGKKEKNLNELKQELEIDVHRVSVDELCKRFTSNVADGLTDDQVKKGIAEYGLNQRSIAKPEKRHWQNLIHSGVVGGWVSWFRPYSAIPFFTWSSVRPSATLEVNLLQSSSTLTLCTSISSSCLSSFKFFSFFPDPRPILPAA